MKTIENRIDDLETRMDKIKDTLDFIKDRLEVGNVENVPAPKKPTFDDRYNMLMECEKQKIKSIMKNFDFERVHKVMELLDWHWAFTSNGVPTVEEIKHEAEGILINACEEETNIATGGFRAVYEKDGTDDGEPYIGLEFIVEDCEGFAEDDDDDDGEKDDADDWVE